MAGIIVQLIISFLLLKFIEKRNLHALGILPAKENLKETGVGFLLASGFVTIFWVSTSFLVDNHFKINTDYSLAQFFNATWYVVKSVLFEELIFRGAILFILIQRIGPRKAIIVSAVAFGIYHWFSFGLFGQPVNMAVTFFATGVMGCVLALAFYKTKSIYLPIALHFGYNFTSMVIFSTDKGIGSQWLVKTDVRDPVSPGPVVSTFVMMVYFIGFPLLTYLYLRSISGKSKPNFQQPSTSRP